MVDNSSPFGILGLRILICSIHVVRPSVVLRYAVTLTRLALVVNSSHTHPSVLLYDCMWDHKGYVTASVASRPLRPPAFCFMIIMPRPALARFDELANRGSCGRTTLILVVIDQGQHVLRCGWGRFPLGELGNAVNTPSEQVVRISVSRAQPFSGEKWGGGNRKPDPRDSPSPSPWCARCARFFPRFIVSGKVPT